MINLKGSQHHSRRCCWSEGDGLEPPTPQPSVAAVIAEEGRARKPWSQCPLRGSSVISGALSQSTGRATPRPGDLAPLGVRAGLLLGLAPLCASSTDQRGAVGAPCGIWGPWLTQPLCCECQSKGPCDGNSRILALKKVPHKRCPHRAGASSAPEVCRSNHVHPNLANTLLPHVTQQLSGQAAPLPPSPPRT